MDVLIVGSVALDDVRTPLGEVKNALGGSAVYASLAAGFFARPGLVGVVGHDFPEAHVDLLRQRGVAVDGLERAEGETFHWSGYYEYDMASAHTLDTRLNVFASFAPKIPTEARRVPFVFLANIDPELQLEVLKRMETPRFVLLDTMNYWIDTKRDALLEVMKQVHMVVVNDAEARQLSGRVNLLQAARWIQSLGPQGVMVKKGENGALVLWDGHLGVLPAYPLETVKDPTGAGDTFAGGFIGALAQAGHVNMTSVKSAAVMGTLLASFVVEEFSVNRLSTLRPEDVQERHRQLRTLAELQEWNARLAVPPVRESGPAD